jgi:hypothetical protein
MLSLLFGIIHANQQSADRHARNVLNDEETIFDGSNFSMLTVS